MPNLELTDWLYLGGAALLMVVVLAALKVLYSLKGFSELPPTKPAFVLLPKYVVPLLMRSADVEADFSSLLGLFGFRELRRDAKLIVFSRGSALGDFSFKMAKVIATSSLPLSSPVQLKIEYGVVFGCAFDTGDLWKFCNELTEKVAAVAKHQDSEHVETGNPYQSPQS